jgi:VWFA-related protein
MRFTTSCQKPPSGLRAERNGEHRTVNGALFSNGDNGSLFKVRRSPLRPASLIHPLKHLRLVCLFAAISVSARAQDLTREISLPASGEIVITNNSGRVTVNATDENATGVSLKAATPGRAVADKEVVAETKGSAVNVTVRPDKPRDRIDLTLNVPPRSRVKITTGEGAVDVIGMFALAQVSTDTGTIHAETPFDEEEQGVNLEWLWLTSRPRFFSEDKLPDVKEKRGGQFSIKGKLGAKKPAKDKLTELKFVTQRGVVLFNVDPAMVPTDLRERALTTAAQAFVRSGNESLSEAVRAVSPRMFGEYTKGLPPPRGAAPVLVEAKNAKPNGDAPAAATQLLRLNVSVTTPEGRAVTGLDAADFTVYENGQARPIKSLETSSAPFNLVLLLDVSGSVESRIDFIRKAARDFLKVASRQDKISIISFRDDIQLISDFTPDRQKLYDSLHEIEAGGATALYDALGYALISQLKPLRGERTAVVIMSDGDDNRSFLPFGRILPEVYESGALVYPLYMPSGLIPETGRPRPDLAADPVRARYLTLTTRAQQEGRELARVSGGVYYPIAQLSDLQAAYEDVVAQLRTAYTITYESPSGDPKKARPRVTTKRNDAQVRVSSVIAVK